MKPIISVRRPPAEYPGFHIDLKSFEAPMKVGLARVAVFLGYAVHTTTGEPLAAVGLNPLIELSVGVPDPVPEKHRAGYQAEYRRWAIGLGLTEIDQTYQRYVVSAIDTLSAVQHWLATKQFAPNTKPNTANSWKVHKQFFEKCGRQLPERDDEAGWLRSLGNARNCLAHGSGVVHRHHLTESDTMPVRWPGQDMYMQAEDMKGRTLLARDKPHYVEKDHIGKQVMVEHVIRERIFKEGDRIELSAIDLSEILFFYQTLAISIAQTLRVGLEHSGVKFES